MHPDKKKVIAIDGHEAAGKGIASMFVAEHLGFTKLDTGSIYRTVALLVHQAQIDHRETMKVVRFVEEEIVRLSLVEGKLFLDNEPVGEEIRTPLIGNLTPLISPIPAIRRLLIPLQRQCVTERGLVAEGRDMGSVVFPDAELKVFLTATPEKRAARRFAEFQRKGQEITYEQVLLNLKQRDLLDETRADSPLVHVNDAHLIDTGDMTREEVGQTIVNLWRLLESSVIMIRI